MTSRRCSAIVSPLPSSFSTCLPHSLASHLISLLASMHLASFLARPWQRRQDAAFFLSAKAGDCPAVRGALAFVTTLGAKRRYPCVADCFAGGSKFLCLMTGSRPGHKCLLPFGSCSWRAQRSLA